MSIPNFAGARIGRYVLVNKIGKGASGNVYEGRDWMTNRPVAIKVLVAELSEDEEFRRRFQKEIQVLSALQHPNIPAIIDSGEDNGMLYFAMHLVTGSMLRVRLDTAPERRLSPVDTWKILNQAAQALDYAHRNNIIHRDVKPENIMIEPTGHVYLMDFGISKLLGGTALTRTGMALGTPVYMSPEQVYGLTPVPQTDIYALGVVAFEMLTGVPPFDSKRVVEIMFKHANDLPPALDSVNPSLPLGLNAVIQRVLAKNPNDRYPTGSAFMGDFARYLG